MKKVIMTAALAIAACAGAQAQTSATNTQNVTVPMVLQITTFPSPANQSTTLTDGALANTNALPDVAYKVRSNGPWSLSAAWAVTCSPLVVGTPTATSITAFRNAYEVSVDGTNWMGFPSNSGSALPIPGFTNIAATSYAGTDVTMNHHVKPLNFNVVPGTYTAALTLTVSQP